MKLSIITPSFNQAAFLEATLRSVLDQEYDGLEYLVVDGGSTDGSVEILRRYSDRLAWWSSEPDRGQAHAVNKGLARATGEVVAFLNSDDLYLPGALATAARAFREDPGCNWLCGDTLLFGEGRRDQVVRARVPRSAAHCLSWAYRAPQPGMFWRRELLAGGFDEGRRYCFDHDLYVRLLLAGHRCRHLRRVVAGYRLHPASKTVAESSGFDQEFDAIAAAYEPRLTGAGRRWCRATRLLRESYAAGARGDRKSAARCWMQALRLHPEGVIRRPFWGCLRRLLTGRVEAQ